MSSRYVHLGSATTTQHATACDTPVIHGCPTNLLQRLADQTAYGAVVADACEFNRGLSRGRAARLPFVDLATRTTQRPAPWLYRPQCDRFKDAEDGGTHIVLRYLRHRWRLDSPPLSRRRKLAADRLWYTLQTGLNALGVPAELVPVVTKRAYTIAGLPIPPLLANSLDSAMPKQGPTPHQNGSFSGTVNSSANVTNSSASNVTGSGTGGCGRTSASLGTVSSKRLPNMVAEITTVDLGRKLHSRIGVSNTEEDAELVEDMTTMCDGSLLRSRSNTTHQDESNASLVVVVSGGEDSGHSNETGAVTSGVIRRSGVAQVCPEEEMRTDDETQSVHSGTGGLVSGTRTGTKSYEIEPDVETEDEDDQAADADGDEDAEMEEELDDDVEWMHSGRRRSARGFATRRAFNSTRTSRAIAGASKGNRFGLSGGRLTSRHINTGQRNLGGRQKVSISG
ncbi:unnamed protein product [Echinostoma caproni]|uniref:Requiem_N domain-containing protein n=1 Tax=Echinostoma caproni TaxID=27848 RepID=A0A183AUR9_9TREM|nr:unnamed protein product [Echinostoma caproni]